MSVICARTLAMSSSAPVERAEGGERVKRAKLENILDQSEAVKEGIAAGHIDVSEGETVELETLSRMREQKILAHFERKKFLKSILVPTDDNEVKRHLRELGEPRVLFGENPAGRRERLKALVADQPTAETSKRPPAQVPASAVVKGETADQVWYHRGPDLLKKCRYWLTEYSLSRARDRLSAERSKSEKGTQFQEERTKQRQAIQKILSSLTNHCSQIGDTRPISFCHFSPNSQMVATASWSGQCKIWSVPACTTLHTLRGHGDKSSCIKFHPYSTVTQSESELNLASCAADGTVCLWSLSSAVPLHSLEGHLQRVARLSFHPSGRFLGTACYDSSWRLWDLETCTEVLHQEGHSASLYNIAFHPDGSLAGSCGLDAYGRMWDLRSGKCVMLLGGHSGNVLAIDFSPNGVSVATGSEDHSARIWDLRGRRCIYTLPAHSSLVSHVVFQKTTGQFLLTSGYDRTAKAWLHPGWAPLRTLAGHDGKVMCVDVSQDDSYVLTTSYDRTFKLWQTSQI